MCPGTIQGILIARLFLKATTHDEERRDESLSHRDEGSEKIFFSATGR